MTKQDLKVGMLVELQDTDDGTCDLCMVLPKNNGYLGLSGAKKWCSLDRFDDDLTDRYFDRQITKVYNYAYTYQDAYKLNVEDRLLLWERKEVKELTVSEIEKLLGYPVKIVKE